MSIYELSKIFMPHAVKRVHNAKDKKQNFVHYTTADTALKILANKEIWMRNASCMNDYTEVVHGMELVASCWNSPLGDNLKQKIDALFPGASEKLQSYYNGYHGDIKFDTYLSCFSEHCDSENDLGRLSMWRAYGGTSGVALVFSGAPFFREDHNLNVFASPVTYLTKVEFESYFKEMIENVDRYADFIGNQSEEDVFRCIFNYLVFSAVCTKHLGFEEEREWRVISVPRMWVSEFTKKEIEIIRGDPQIVQKLKIENNIEKGVDWLDIRDILHRVIIGPSENAYAIRDAFCHMLHKNLKIGNPDDMVAVSNIPLRH